MNKEKLLLGAALLEKHAESGEYEFDMEQWGKVKPCGTSCCAMGLFAMSGAFNGLGFYVKEMGHRIGLILGGNRVDGFSAGSRVFDISNEESYNLFEPKGVLDFGPDGMRAKARQIRRFVETGTIPYIEECGE